MFRVLFFICFTKPRGSGLSNHLSLSHWWLPAHIKLFFPFSSLNEILKASSFSKEIRINQLSTHTGKFIIWTLLFLSFNSFAQKITLDTTANIKDKKKSAVFIHHTTANNHINNNEKEKSEIFFICLIIFLLLLLLPFFLQRKSPLRVCYFFFHVSHPQIIINHLLA
uniref:Uncharacterized protein n=1 Tax=Panagrolaimus sp. PS1159 TaxID=55785 RepID=A0AC35FBB7_9BILA